MGSTNKTSLGLNSWIGSDKPQREDFNSDNEIIDNAITAHIEDDEAHISPQEREMWNSFVKMGTYFGDGKVERTIELDCDFAVSFIIIFARNRAVSSTVFSQSKNYNYTAFVSRTSSSMGAKIGSDLKSIIVSQSATAVMNNEFANLNESGVAYTYILFR